MRRHGLQRQALGARRRGDADGLVGMVVLRVGAVGGVMNLIYRRRRVFFLIFYFP
jgi:hypothetical protein